VTTKCLLVCDNDFLVAGVRALLAKQTELEIDTVYADSEMELVKTIETSHPDVVILDEGFYTVQPAELRELRGRLPNLLLIILNQVDDVLQVFQGSLFEESQGQDLGKIIIDHELHS
jgi:DNA-binding NarL/FixJ family response regulator